jgi:MFS family permease
VPEAPHPIREVLALRDVRNLVSARFFATLGRSLLHATLHWHLWKATDSLFNLGLLGLVEFLPVIPFSLVAGAVADNRDRRRIVMVSQLVAMLCAGMLVYGSLQGTGELGLILLAAFALAVAGSFEHPAGAALLPGLVSRELFPAATILSSNVRNVAGVSGPVLMGFIAAEAGIPAAYGATLGLLLVSIVLLVFVRSPEIEGGGRPVDWSSVREGLAFVWQRKVILGSMTLDMFAVLFAGVTAMLPVFATDILNVGERGYGLLSASTQAGTVLMALLLLAFPRFHRPGRALVVAVLFFGLSSVAFGVVRSFPLAVLALVAGGVADQLSMVARSIILQLATPDALRGRVNAVNMIFIGASNELGDAQTGFLASVTSAVFAVVFGGLACIGVVGAVHLSIPALWAYRVDDNLPGQAD